MVKKGYCRNEGFSLAYDHIKVCQINSFNTTFYIQRIKEIQNLSRPDQCQATDNSQLKRYRNTQEYSVEVHKQLQICGIKSK